MEAPGYQDDGDDRGWILNRERERERTRRRRTTRKATRPRDRAVSYHPYGTYIHTYRYDYSPIYTGIIYLLPRRCFIYHLLPTPSSPSLHIPRIPPCCCQPRAVWANSHRNSYPPPSQLVVYPSYAFPELQHESLNPESQSYQRWSTHPRREICQRVFVSCRKPERGLDAYQTDSPRQQLLAQKTTSVSDVSESKALNRSGRGNPNKLWRHVAACPAGTIARNW